MEKLNSCRDIIFDKLCYALLVLTRGECFNSDKKEKRLQEERAHCEKRVDLITKRRRRLVFRAKHSRRCDSRYLHLLAESYGLKQLARKKSRLKEKTEFWREIIENQELPELREQQSNSLKRAVINGIPISLRGQVWQHATDSQRLQKLHPSGLYRDLCDSQRNRTIAIDVPRTFPKHPKFLEPETQQALYNILTAYAAYNPKVGYVQSLNFIAALFLYHMDEEQAFWMLVAYMESYKMESFYFEGMKTLQLNVSHFSNLVLQSHPKLYKHFRKENVEPSVFVTPWFLTHFIYDLPIELAARVWDVLLVMNMRSGEFVYRFGLSFLTYASKELSKMHFNALAEKLKILPLTEEGVAAVCELALDLELMTFSLKQEIPL